MQLQFNITKHFEYETIKYNHHAIKNGHFNSFKHGQHVISVTNGIKITQARVLNCKIDMLFLYDHTYIGTDT